MLYIKRKDKGFTLIELLSVIVILAIVSGLVIYVAINVINNSKENSYKVTINNIEDNVKDYLIENSDRLFYVTNNDNSDIEYQCITVRDLVDFGYFKNDILESKISNNRKVQLDDYIYIERNIDTKAIIETRYLINEDVSLCNNANEVMGDVNIDIYPTGYSSYKDITIRYRLKNYYNIDDYSFGYSYDKNDALSIISDDGDVKKLRVTDNGKISGYIYDKNNNIIADSYKDITNIDKIPPVIEMNDLVKVYGSSFDLMEGVTITDNSNMDVSSKIYIENNEIFNSSSLVLGENFVTYKVVDMFGNESVASRKITLVVADKEFNYKEENQIYKVLVDGTYIVDVYGAQGGNSGGLGGYVKAEVLLKAGDELIINTGGVNGYNGGGGYGNSSYYPGGGATTVRNNGNYIVIAGGGGAKGNVGTAGAGGNGNGLGGTNVGSGAGISGSNGGGGSNSRDYSYSCNCDTCGGGCKPNTDYYCNCREVEIACNPNITKPSIQCYIEQCDTCCEHYPKYSCNCETCTNKGNSGSGGKNSVIGSALFVENISGNRSGNGYAKIGYKLEG